MLSKFLRLFIYAFWKADFSNAFDQSRPTENSNDHSPDIDPKVMKNDSHEAQKESSITCSYYKRTITTHINCSS